MGNAGPTLNDVRWGFIDSVLRVATAAEELARSGAREPALILYRELSRSGVPTDVALQRDATLDERIGAARAELARFLRAELCTELGRVQSFSSKLRLGVVVAALAGIALALSTASHAKGELSEGARWTASSHWDVNPASGVLPTHGFFFSPPAYFFHTLAEPEPWLSIDLGRERRVSSVSVENRLDGCRERERGIRVEVSTDGVAFERVASHPTSDTAFREWTSRFFPTKARYVRIVGTPNEMLHLSDVRIFGS
ncbi:MAG TPA: discoidin domain-containing protein [Polyangiaceae bacterium]|nr:discoidin domain-containing protein [Polyangiaceae bacterium]